MFRDKNAVWKQLTDLWDDTEHKVPTLPIEGRKYAFLSDLHLGNGSGSDDFANNRLALQYALEYYLRHGFTLILVGDVEELWQFDLSAIIGCYEASIYHLLRQFKRENRIIRIFGNHDLEWGGLADPISDQITAFGAPEAVRLHDTSGANRILVVHGHQGTIESDKFSWFSRFFVRIFGTIEPIARMLNLYNNPSAPKSQIAKDFERTLYQWAKANKVILICGHTHRAIFASKSYAERIMDRISKMESENASARIKAEKRLRNTQEINHLKNELNDEKEKGRIIDAIDPGSELLPYYFNCGCGVYSDGLTGLEMEDDNFRLVKWARESLDDENCRKVLQTDKVSGILDLCSQ